MRRTLLKAGFAAVAAVALAVAIAQAERAREGKRQGGPPPCTDPMPADMQAKLLEDFGEKGIDANADGTLTCEEVKAFFDANPSLRPPPPHGRGPCGPPPRVDPIPAEIQSKLLTEFGEKGIDADADGTLTCEEIKAFFDANPSLRPPPPPHGRGPCGPPPCVDPIPAEIQSKLLTEFGEKGIDANADGTLTCEEVKAFFDANPSLRPPPPPGDRPPCDGHGPKGRDVQSKSGPKQTGTAKTGSSAVKAAKTGATAKKK